MRQQQQTNLFNLPPSDFDHFSYQNSVALVSAAASQAAMNGNTNPNRSSPYPFGGNNTTSSSGSNLPSFNYHLASAPEIPIRRRMRSLEMLEETTSSATVAAATRATGKIAAAAATNDNSITLAGSSGGSGAGFNSKTKSSARGSASLSSAHRSDKSVLEPDHGKGATVDGNNQAASGNEMPGTKLSEKTSATTKTANPLESSSGASSNNSSASSSIARGAVQLSSLTRAHTSSAILTKDENKQLQRHKQPNHHDLSSAMSETYETTSSLNRHIPLPTHHDHRPTVEEDEDFLAFQSSRSPKFWHSSKFNFIKKLLQVKQQRLLRQQSKDRRIYNNKVQNKFRLVMMDLTHFNKSQQLLTTENGVNSLLTSMRNVLEFGLYLTVKLY